MTSNALVDVMTRPNCDVGEVDPLALSPVGDLQKAALLCFDAVDSNQFALSPLGEMRKP